MAATNKELTKEIKISKSNENAKACPLLVREHDSLDESFLHNYRQHELYHTINDITVLMNQNNKLEKMKTVAEMIKCDSPITHIILTEHNDSFKDETMNRLKALIEKRTPTIYYQKAMCCEGVIYIAYALKNNKKITHIKFSNTYIGNKGAIALAEMLKVNTTLTSLNMHNNRIGTKGIIAIADSIKNSKTLKHISLYRNDIDNVGALAFAEALEVNKHLVSLRLNSCKISSKGAKAIFTALRHNKSLEHLDLYNNTIGVLDIAAVAKTIKENSSLTKLALNISEIENGKTDNEFMEFSNSISSNKTLSSLKIGLHFILSRNAIALAKAIKTNTSLNELELNYVRMNHIEIIERALVLNTNIINLSLHHLGTYHYKPSELFNIIKLNKNILSLDLSRSNIDCESAEKIAKAIMVNSSLKELILSNNNIGDRGVEKIAEAIKTNKTLTCITLDNNLIRNKGAKAILDAMRVNDTLIYLTLSDASSILSCSKLGEVSYNDDFFHKLSILSKNDKIEEEIQTKIFRCLAENQRNMKLKKSITDGTNFTPGKSILIEYNSNQSIKYKALDVNIDNEIKIPNAQNKF